MKDWLLYRIRKSGDADGIWKGGMSAMLILLLLFLAAAVRERDNIILWAVLYGAANLLVFTAVYLALTHHVRSALYALGDMMEELISGRGPGEGEEEAAFKMAFPIAQETILSKLQGQILKLYDILCANGEQEQKLRKQLDENIGNLVHQLGTPITNIRLYVGFLKRDDLTAQERKRFLQCMEEQADKIFWLGESFSRVSRLETGLIRLKPEQQAVEPVVLNALNQVVAKAENKKMEIVLSGETRASALIDKKWTAEALFNILDNAVKYGKPGTQIEIAAKELTSYVSIAVRNRSEKEISPDEYPLLFKRFYREEEVHDIEGIGIGLYLAREIVTMQGGYIKVASKVGDGSTFSIFLPHG